LNRINLREQKRLTGLDLIWPRIAIIGRTALNHVGNIDVIPLKVDRFDNLRKELASATHAGNPLLVFVSTGCFPDKHQIGSRITDTIHKVSPGRMQITAFALAKVLS